LGDELDVQVERPSRRYRGPRGRRVDDGPVGRVGKRDAADPQRLVAGIVEAQGGGVVDLVSEGRVGDLDAVEDHPRGGGDDVEVLQALDGRVGRIGRGRDVADDPDKVDEA